MMTPTGVRQLARCCERQNVLQHDGNEKGHVMLPPHGPSQAAGLRLDHHVVTVVVGY